MFLVGSVLYVVCVSIRACKDGEAKSAGRTTKLNLPLLSSTVISAVWLESRRSFSVVLPSYAIDAEEEISLTRTAASVYSVKRKCEALGGDRRPALMHDKELRMCADGAIDGVGEVSILRIRHASSCFIRYWMSQIVNSKA